MNKERNFNNFKAIAGITFFIVIILTFIKLLSNENDNIMKIIKQ